MLRRQDDPHPLLVGSDRGREPGPCRFEQFRVVRLAPKVLTNLRRQYRRPGAQPRASMTTATLAENIVHTITSPDQ